ncbi:MAG: translocation/assembly module TamB domain-containing protein [Gammaproteobacteria bacterium]
MARRILQAVGGSLLVLLILIGLAVVSPPWAEPLTGPLRSGLVRAVAAAVSLSLDGSLHIGSLQGSLLRNPTVSDILLRDAEGKTVVSIDELRLQYTLSGLLKARLHILAIEIRQPTLHLAQEADGRLNLQRVLSTEPTPADPRPPTTPTLAIKLDKLLLQGGDVHLALSGLPGTQTIEDITLRLRGELAPHGSRLELQELTARSQRSETVLKTLRGKLSLTADLIQFDDWLLQTARSTITLSGALPRDLFAVGGPPEKSPTEQAEPSPGPQHPISQNDAEQPQGGVSAAGKPELPGSSRLSEDSEPHRNAARPGSEAPSEPRLSLTLHPLDVAEIGRILGDSALRGMVVGAITAKQVDDSLAMRGRLVVAEGAMDLEAQLTAKHRPAHYHGSLTIGKLDLAQLVNKPGLQSDVNLRLQITGEGLQPSDRSARLQLTIERSHLGAIAIRPSTLRIEARNERLEVRAFDLNTSLLKARLEGAIDLAGASDLTYALTVIPEDLRELIAAKALAGNIQLNGRLLGTWPRLTTAGVLTGEKLTYDDRRLDQLQLLYEASELGKQPRVKARLRARTLRVGNRGVEELSAQGTYSYSDENATHRLHLDAETDQTSPLYARIEASFSADRQVQTLRVPTLVARVEDHTWRATLPLQATFSAPEIRVKPWRLSHGEESIEIAGALIGDAFQDVRLQATDIDLDFLRRLFALPPIVSGRASWQADLSGDLAAPTLRSHLSLRGSGEPMRPIERADLVLSYENGQLDTEFSIIQQARQTIALRSSLPIDLALVAKPIEQRLLDKPLQLGLEIQRPEMAAINLALTEMPPLSGTLEGSLAVLGTYDKVTLNSRAELQKLGVKGAASHLTGPLQLVATVVAAPSMPALRQALATDDLRVAVPDLTVRAPSVTGQLHDHESVTRLSLRHGLAQASADWVGKTLTKASVDLKLRAKVDDLPPVELVSKAHLDAQQLRLEQLRLKTSASELNLVGEVDLHDRSIGLSLDIPLLQLSEFEGLLPPQFPPEVTGTVTVGGTLDTPQLAARLRYAGARINADASARLQEKHQPYRANVRIAGLSLQPFGAPVDGQLHTLLDVQGSRLTEGPHEARISLDLQSKDFALAPELAARLRSRVVGSTASIDLLELTSEPLEFSAHGIFSTTQETDLRYNLKTRDLAAVGKQLGIALQAKGELAGTVKGQFDALRAHSTLELSRWRYGPWQGSQLRASLEGETLTTTPDVRLQAAITALQGPQLASSSLRLEGRLDSAKAEVSLDVTEGPFARSKLAGVLHIEPRWQARIDPLRLQTEHWVWANSEPIVARHDAQGGLTLESLRLSSTGQRLRARGSWSPQGELTGNLRIEDLQIKPTVIAFAPSAPAPDGRLSLNLDVNGTIQQPQLKATLQVDGLQWTEQPVGNVHADIALSDAVWHAKAHWMDGDDMLLSVTGDLNTGESKSIAAHVKAPGLDLTRLQFFSPTIRQSGGQLRVDLQIQGTVDQPSAHGVLELHDARLLHTSIGEPYTNIQTRAIFRGNRLDIERLEVGSSTGLARLEGLLEIDGLALSRADLRLNAREFTAIKTRALEAIVSSDLSVQGSQRELAATGNVTVSRARIRYEDFPGIGLPEVEPWELTVEGVYGPGREAATFGAAEATAAIEAETDPLSFLRADIRLDLPRNVWIQGKGTAIEIGGNLQLQKDLGSPFTLAGDLQSLRGFATVLNRKFDIERAVLTFTGAEDITPVLDISASYPVSGYTVYVSVTGTSEAPDLAYRSDPELDQGDILSLLLFGRTSDRLTSSEQNALAGQAVRFAGGFAADILERTVGQVLGLDSVAIGLGDQDDAISVGAGRYLTQDIYVEYQRKLADPVQGKRVGNVVAVEYSIRRGIKIQATGSDYGETAIDFLWSRDY